MRREAVVEIVICSSIRITFCRLRPCVVIWMIPPERHERLFPLNAEAFKATIM